MGLRRIAITGGPGAGKTTVWRALCAAYPERVVGVPEVATALLAHVFPEVGGEAERKAIQRAIFHVQQNLEAFHEARVAAHQVLLCDRGTPDGAGYWPDGPEAFFASLSAAWEHELARYDAVLFLETAAAGGLSIREGNPVRSEDAARAVLLDRQLFAVWSRHQTFVHVPQEPLFADKVAHGVQLLSRWLP